MKIKRPKCRDCCLTEPLHSIDHRGAAADAHPEGILWREGMTGRSRVMLLLTWWLEVDMQYTQLLLHVQWSFFSSSHYECSQFWPLWQGKSEDLSCLMSCLTKVYMHFIKVNKIRQVCRFPKPKPPEAATLTLSHIYHNLYVLLT